MTNFNAPALQREHASFYNMIPFLSGGWTQLNPICIWSPNANDFVRKNIKMRLNATRDPVKFQWVCQIRMDPSPI
jgi:hypothetical protein